MCIQQEGCPSLNNQEPVLVLKLLLFLSSHLCTILLLYSNVLDCIGKKMSTPWLLECSSLQVEHGLCNWLQWNQFFYNLNNQNMLKLVQEQVVVLELLLF